MQTRQGCPPTSQPPATGTQPRSLPYRPRFVHSCDQYWSCKRRSPSPSAREAFQLVTLYALFELNS